MDMQKAIEFLLESQAKHEGHLQRIDTQLEAIGELIRGGMKMIVSFQTEANRKFDTLIDAQLRTEVALVRLADSQTALAAAQAATELKLQGLIDSLKQPKNGHGTPPAAS